MVGVRVAFCAMSATALLAGCSSDKQAQPPVRPSDPGAPSIIPVPSGGSPSPSRSPRIPGGLPDPRRIDQKDATAVSRAALTVMYTVDSTVDAGLRNARLRAARYLTVAYAAEIKAEPVQYVPEEWRQHRAYFVVRLRPVVREKGAPSDRPTAAFREWGMTTVPTGRDRWRGTRRTSVVYMALVRSSKNAPWRVSDVNVVDGG
jgi:hypothetical protein